MVDEDTVTFRFSAPSPGFLQATSTINSGLLSPETLDGTIEDFGTGNAEEIIGSGPFTVTDEKLGTEYTLTARDDYDWGPDSAENDGRPYLDAVHVLVTPRTPSASGRCSRAKPTTSATSRRSTRTAWRGPASRCTRRRPAA